MNNVTLIGRLTKDVELRYTTNETATVKFTLAVDRIKKDECDFISCTAFGKTAETMSKYLAKGCRVAINGSIRTGSYKDKEGRTVYTTDVVANNVNIIDFKDSGKSYQERKEPVNDFVPIDDEGDLPF